MKGEIMKKYKFLIGDLVFVKQKIHCTNFFLENSLNRRGRVIGIYTTINTINIETDTEVFSFYYDDLIPIRCSTCSNYLRERTDIWCLYKTRCSSTIYEKWKPKEDESYITDPDKWFIKKEEKNMYKLLNTINAKTLWEAYPCNIVAYEKYLNEFGFDDIDETTFPRFIEFAENVSGGIKFLIDKHFIEKVEKEKYHYMGSRYKIDGCMVMLVRPSIKEATLIVVDKKGGNRWGEAVEVSWKYDSINDNCKISETDFNKLYHRRTSIISIEQENK